MLRKRGWGVWGEMCLPHGKLLIAMLTELKPGMSVELKRQVTSVRITVTTQCGKRNNE